MPPSPTTAAAKTSETKPAQGWRENIEALLMAVVVALLFKYFILEISKIPSGSMQPTLMGNPNTGVFDRTVVDKLSLRFRDPERFEIVVFKHPLERSRIMVKRLVGMPGEELKIQYGDVWTRPLASEGETRGARDGWTILRRPPAVQHEMWRSLATRAKRGALWTVVLGGADWRIGEESIRARGDGAVRYRVDGGPIRDIYQDGYPAAVAGKIPVPERVTQDNYVGDLRVEGELSFLADAKAVRIELTEGQRAYEFRLPGPAAEDAHVEVRVRDSATSTERTERGPERRLRAGERVSFAVENLDDRLALELDGETLVTTEVEPSPRQQALITLSVDGAGADLEDLEVFRDVYYTVPDPPAVWSVVIPEGHYVMLGDNTQDSADGRLWAAKEYAYQDASGTLVTSRGNHREGENPLFGTLDGEGAIRFKDDAGEIHWFPLSAKRAEKNAGNEPLVPRELIQGRAVAVFWPIWWPFEDLWRLGWLH